MSYLDKAKTVPSQKSTEPKEVPVTKETNYTKKASTTLQMSPPGLRNNPQPQSVAIPQPPDTLPRLPWQLERLVSAASSDALPKGTVSLSAGLVPDLSSYVLAWAAAYLTGDTTEPLRRLWEAHRAWNGVTL